MNSTTKTPRAPALFLLLALAAPATEAAVLSMDSSASLVNVGGNFDVRLSLSGLSGAPGDSLSGFDVDMMYDPAAFQLTGYHYLDASSARNQLDLPEVGALPFAGGVLDSGSVIDAYGVSGNSDSVLDADQVDSFIFLTLEFLALNTLGLGEISLDLNDPNLMFLDSQFGDLNIHYASTTVQINVISGSGTVPEPATLALSMLGLGLLGLARRR